MSEDLIPPKTGGSYKKYLAVLVLTLFFVSAIFSFFYEKSAKQNSLLKNELKNFIVLPVSSGGKTYTVENGEVKFKGKDVSVFTGERVLHAAYSSALNRLDPIFAVEGTDAVKLEKSAEDLRVWLRNTASLYDKEDAASVESLLYPIDFLKKLSETEGARQKLILTPSPESSGEYYKNLGNLVGLNASYVKRLGEFYQNNKNLFNYKFNFFDGFSTIDTYISELARVESELGNKAAELERRDACASSYSAGCPSLAGALATLATSTVPRAEVAYEPLTKDVLDNTKLVSAYMSSGNARSSTTASNPLIALDSSACFPGIKTVYYQSWLNSDSNGNSFFALQFVNDLYFRDTSDGDTFIKAMAKAGVRYLYQPGANLYRCQSAGSDYSRSIAMDTVQKLLSREPLSSTSGLQKIAPGLVDLERAIISSNTLYESQFDSYINGLALLLSQYGEVGLAEVMGAEKVFYVEKLVSIYRQKSPRFDETIREIIANNTAVGTFIKEGTNIPVRSLFISRGYAPVVLLSYNKSFSENPIKLTRFALFKLDDFGLLSYNEALKKRYGAQKILEMMELGRILQHGK